MEPEGDFISERGLLLPCSGNESVAAEGLASSKSEEIALEKTSQDASETDGTIGGYSDDSAILSARAGKKKRNRRRNKKGRRPDTVEEQYQNLDTHEIHSEVLIPGSRTESADELLDPTTPSISPTSQTPSPSEAGLAVPPKHLDSHEDYVKQDGTYVLNYEKHALEVGEQLKSLEVEWSKGQGVLKNLSPSGRTIPCAPNPSVAEIDISDTVDKANDSVTEIPIDALLASQAMDMNENLMHDAQYAVDPRDVDLPTDTDDDSLSARNSSAKGVLDTSSLYTRSATESEVSPDRYASDSDVSDATCPGNIDTENEDLLNYLSASAANILLDQFRSTTEIVEVTDDDDIANYELKPEESISDDILGNSIVDSEISDGYIVDSSYTCDDRMVDYMLSSCVVCDDILDDCIVDAFGASDDILDDYIVDENISDDDQIIADEILKAGIMGDEVHEDIADHALPNIPSFEKADIPDENCTEAHSLVEVEADDVDDNFPGTRNFAKPGTPNDHFQPPSPRLGEPIDIAISNDDDHYSAVSLNSEDTSFGCENLDGIDVANDELYDLTDISTCGSEVEQSDDYLYDMLEGQDSCLTVVASGSMLNSDLSQPDDVPSEESLHGKDLSVTEILVENLLNVPSPSEADMPIEEEFEPLNQIEGLTGIDKSHDCASNEAEFPAEASVTDTQSIRPSSASPSSSAVDLHEFNYAQLSNEGLSHVLSDTEVSSEEQIPIELSESQRQLPVLCLNAIDDISTWKNNNPEHVGYLYKVVDGIIVTAMEKVSEIQIEELLKEDKAEGSVSKEILDEFEESPSVETKSDSMNNFLVVKGQEDYDDVYPNEVHSDEIQPNLEIRASPSVHDGEGWPVFPLGTPGACVTCMREESVDADPMAIREEKVDVKDHEEPSKWDLTQQTQIELPVPRPPLVLCKELTPERIDSLQHWKEPLPIVSTYEEPTKPVRTTAAELVATSGGKVQTDSKIPDDQKLEDELESEGASMLDSVNRSEIQNGVENGNIPEVLSSEVVKDPYLHTKSQIEPGTAPDPITHMIVGEEESQFLCNSASDSTIGTGNYSESRESIGSSTKYNTGPRESSASKAKQNADTFPRRSKVDEHEQLGVSTGSRARRASLGRRVMRGIHDIVVPIVLPCRRANEEPEDMIPAHRPVMKKSASNPAFEAPDSPQSAKPEEPTKKFGSLRRMMNRK